MEGRESAKFGEQPKHGSDTQSLDDFHNVIEMSTDMSGNANHYRIHALWHRSARDHNCAVLNLSQQTGLRSLEST